MDYIRHPGILSDLAGNESAQTWEGSYGGEHHSAYEDHNNVWSKLDVRRDVLDPSIWYAPQIDALFTNVSRIYVFGDKFKVGYGMHDVHQNQGDKEQRFKGNDGLYRDGAVIFEYPNGSRKILMIKFRDHNVNNTTILGQTDFSYSTDPDGSGPLIAGEAAPKTTVSYWFEPDKNPNGKTYGPFYAEQIEIIVNNSANDCMSEADTDVYVSEHPSVSRFNYRLYSRRPSCWNEYIRSSRDLMEYHKASVTNRYYIHVYPRIKINSFITIAYR